MSKYVIRSAKYKDDDDIPLYWNNRSGWVNVSEAEIFTYEDLLEFDLPMGGRWERCSN